MVTDEEKKAKIRELNDRLRTTGKGGMVVATGRFGQESADIEKINRVIAMLRTFDGFVNGDDPYQEHDFGKFTVDGEEFLFKIDYYDLNMEEGSPAPEDPAQTKRVLSVFYASDY